MTYAARYLPKRLRHLKFELTKFYGFLKGYYRCHRRLPNLFRPRSFSEKLAYRILFDRRPIITVAADKIAAREYASVRLGADILPRLYCLVRDGADIPFDSLPSRFVVKPENASGRVRIVTDKAAIDRTELIQQCQEWLDHPYYYRTGEWGYKHAKPGILVEQFIDDESGRAPRDYKFFVFGGKVAMVQVDGTRFTGHRRSLFDRDWNLLPVRYGYEPLAAEDKRRPAHFAQMLEAAETLGSGLDFVRADFYDTPQRIYFGEITMTPECGTMRIEPLDFDTHLGSLWQLPPWRELRTRDKHTDSQLVSSGAGLAI